MLAYQSMDIVVVFDTVLMEEDRLFFLALRPARLATAEAKQLPLRQGVRRYTLDFAFLIFPVCLADVSLE